MEKFTHNKESLEIENGVLGALILESYAVELIEGDLKPSIFANEANRDICIAILELRKEKIAIDVLTVCQKLKDLGKFQVVGGGFYVASLTDRVASCANIQYHVKILQELFLVRETARICQGALVKCNERGSDGFDIVSETIKKLEQTEIDLTSNKEFDTINNIGDKFLFDIEEIRSGIKPPSITTGLHKLNTAGGFFNSDLIILAARPAMGKTALALKFVRNCVITLNKPCGVFSLEMSSTQLLTRMASSECQIDSERIRDAKTLENYEVNALHKKINELKSAPLYIDSTGGINIDHLFAKARRMKREFKIELLVIDYLQLITTSEYRGDKTRQVGYISNRLKVLAKELDIPVIALSQLSRSIESRKPEDRMPIMSDLRESGDIEQDADQIMFIFRPEYYGLETLFIGGQEVNIKGKALISYAKNRHGSLLTDLFKFYGPHTDFMDDVFYSDKLEQLQPLQNNNSFLDRNDIEETFN